MYTSAIIPAAGSGERFGGKKQLKNLAGRPLLYHTLQPFIRSLLVNEIVVVAPIEDVDSLNRELRSTISKKPIKVVAGGESRQSSVFNGLLASKNKSKLICVHDAVRPFITEDIIEKAVKACNEHDGVIVAEPSTDTIKRIQGNQILETIPRECVWRAQTPQIFSKVALEEALKLAKEKDINGTDEASILERIGYQVGFVAGSPLNIKITNKEDWIFAEAIYNHLAEKA